MAGTLTISTLKDSSGVLATQNGMTGICKAWVDFDGTTSPGTIRDSFNVGSVTKNATGDYTINFTTSMANANYAGQVCIGAVGTSDGVGGGYSNATRIAASFRIRTLNSTQSASKDFDSIYVVVNGS